MRSTLEEIKNNTKDTSALSESSGDKIDVSKESLMHEAQQPESKDVAKQKNMEDAIEFMHGLGVFGKMAQSIRGPLQINTWEDIYGDSQNNSSKH